MGPSGWFSEGFETVDLKTARALLDELAVAPPPYNVPTQPTPFIGREAELTALDDLIANPEIRLITIVGPGGMGKTRLALASAERHLETGRFPNGIYFVPLAPLSSVDHIIPTMAEALDFPLDAGGKQTRTPKQQILDYLREKRMLIVMDNFEHLLDGVELVANILQAAPEVQILATSRERLHLHEEQVYPIQGLEFPDWETPEDAAEYAVEAIRARWEENRDTASDWNIPALLKERAEEPTALRNDGDLESAFGSAARVFENTYYVPYVSNAQMEPSASVARWDGDHLTVWAGTQRPHRQVSGQPSRWDMPALLILWIRWKVREPERWVAARETATAEARRVGSVRDLFSRQLIKVTLLGVALSTTGIATF